MTVRYLVLGKTGYIAQAICKELQSRDIHYVALSRSVVDYTNMSCLDDHIALRADTYLRTKSPLNVINCAGYIGKPNVDACEDKLSETVTGNSILPARLADLCKRRGIQLAHISSGCIYNGYDKKYTEDCPSDFDFNNGSVYSGSKDLGEQLIRDVSDQHFIFRLRIPFDHIPSPRNYITKMLTYDTLLDAVNAMSNRQDFARAVVTLLEMKAPFGTYNISNPGAMSTNQVIELIKEYISPEQEYTFFTDHEDFNKRVKAPRSNCVLDTSKMEKYIQIPSIQLSMEKAISQYNKQ